MSMVKFPTQINPARLTVTLLRVDETIRSPLTNIQQVISRGNPAWQWTYEYKDLSSSERGVVQAFLMKCRGSVNVFKVTDPGNYGTDADVSSWSDIFDDLGDFSNVDSAGFAANFSVGATNQISGTLTTDGMIESRIVQNGGGDGLKYIAESSLGRIGSLEVGAIYAARVKGFNGQVTRSGNLRLGPADGTWRGYPPTAIESDGMLTTVIAANVNTMIPLVAEIGSNFVGDNWKQADFRLARCLVVTNSENLLTRSSEFDHADYSATRINVTSGFGLDHHGNPDKSWKLFADSSNNTHFINQTFVKTNTPDTFTFFLKARQAEKTRIRLRLHDGTNGADGFFDLSSATLWQANSHSTVFAPNFSRVIDIGSDYVICALTANVNSHSNLIAEVSLVDSDGSLSWTDGVGSDGVEIVEWSLQRGPVIGFYSPTVSSSLVGSDWQVGSRLGVAGADPGMAIAKAGDRFEVVNQFYNVNSGTYERSEFKRMTADIYANYDGTAILEFEPPIRNAPKPMWTPWLNVGDLQTQTMANPVIFSNPEMKGRLVAGTVQYTDKSLMLTDITFEVIEDMTE